MAEPLNPPNDLLSEVCRMIWRCARFQNPEIDLLPENEEQRKILTPPPELFDISTDPDVAPSDTGIEGHRPNDS